MSTEPVTQVDPTEASHSAPARDTGRWFAPTLAAVYLVMILIQLTHHVMWRDELRPWQIIKQCGSVGEMIAAMRYDAVPPLWNLIIFVLTRFTGNPVAMQIVHAVIASATVYVIARWAPFPRSIKMLFPLGYFPLFEYAVLARNYALVFLLLMISCAIIARPRVNLLALAAVLFLLAQTSIWGAGFASLMLGAGIVTAWSSEVEPKPRPWELIVAVVIVLLGGLLCAATIRPGPGPSFVPKLPDMSVLQRLSLAVTTATKALVPIPRWSLHFWNTNVLDDFPAMQAGLGAILLISIGAMFYRRRIAIILYVAGAAGLLAFALVFPGSTRHGGHLFMLVIACFWIAERNATIAPWGRKLLTSILGVQAIVGIAVAIAAMILPFSMSRQVADFIRANFKLDQIILAGIPDFCTSPISEWLDRPIYFPEMRRFARVNTQNDADRPGTNPPAMLNAFCELMQETNKPILLIADAGFYLTDSDTLFMPSGPFAGRLVQVRVLPSFEGGIVETENAKLYLITLAP